eukprot:366486-Chlamydomonas_euryale.AAC.17
MQTTSDSGEARGTAKRAMMHSIFVRRSLRHGLYFQAFCAEAPAQHFLAHRIPRQYNVPVTVTLAYPNETSFTLLP